MVASAFTTEERIQELLLNFKGLGPISLHLIQPLGPLKGLNKSTIDVNPVYAPGADGALVHVVHNLLPDAV